MQCIGRNSNWLYTRLLYIRSLECIYGLYSCCFIINNTHIQTLSEGNFCPFYSFAIQFNNERYNMIATNQPTTTQYSCNKYFYILIIIKTWKLSIWSSRCLMLNPLVVLCRCLGWLWIMNLNSKFERYWIFHPIE